MGLFQRITGNMQGRGSLPGTLPFGQKVSQRAIEDRNRWLAQRSSLPAYDGSWKGQTQRRALGEAEQAVADNFSHNRLTADRMKKLNAPYPLVEAAYKHCGAGLFSDAKQLRKLSELLGELSNHISNFGWIDPQISDAVKGHRERFAGERVSRAQRALEIAGQLLDDLDPATGDHEYVKLRAVTYAMSQRGQWEHADVDAVMIARTAALYTPGVGEQLVANIDDPALLADLWSNPLGPDGDEGRLYVTKLQEAAASNPNMDPAFLTGLLYRANVPKQIKINALTNPSLPSAVRVMAALDPTLPDAVSIAAMSSLSEDEKGYTQHGLDKMRSALDAMMDSPSSRELLGGLDPGAAKVLAKTRKTHSGLMRSEMGSPGIAAEDMMGAYLTSYHTEYVLYPWHPWSSPDQPPLPPPDLDAPPPGQGKAFNWTARTSQEPALADARVFAFSSHDSNASHYRQEMVNITLEGAAQVIDSSASLAVIDPELSTQLQAELMQMGLWSGRPALSPQQQMVEDTYSVVQRSVIKAMNPDASDLDL